MASTSSVALQQKTSSYWRQTTTHSPLIHVYSVIACGQGHGNGFLQLAVKDILLDFLSTWTNSSVKAAGNNTISPKNGQAETEKMCSWTSSFLIKSAVFIKTAQNIYILKCNWHFVTFEYYHIPKILNSLIIKAKKS